LFLKSNEYFLYISPHSMGISIKPFAFIIDKGLPFEFKVAYENGKLIVNKKVIFGKKEVVKVLMSGKEIVLIYLGKYIHFNVEKFSIKDTIYFRFVPSVPLILSSGVKLYDKTVVADTLDMAIKEFKDFVYGNKQ
jgi:hypothetical protein